MDNHHQARHNTISGHRDARVTIGYMTPSLGRYEAAMFFGVADAAQEHDVNVLCFVCGHLHEPTARDEQANVLFDLAGTDNVAGLVFNSTLLSSAMRTEDITRYHSLPSASIGFVEGIPSIDVECESGMRELVTHLIDVHKCRRIALIRGHQGHPEDAARYRAYAETLSRYHLPLDPNLVTPHYPWTGDWRHTSREAMAVLFDERRLRPQVDVDAIIGNNDASAISVMEVLRERGIQVPDDITVVGFDNVEMCQVVTPPLTTVRQPTHERTRWAVETVLAQREGRPVSEHVILPTTLVSRQSCGCLDPMTAQAAAGVMPAAQETCAVLLTTQREEIVTAMTLAAIGTSGTEPATGWAAQLCEGFARDMHGSSPGAFLRALNTVCRQIRASGGDVGAWQNGVSALRRRLLPTLAGPALARAEDLWQQARVAIGRIVEHVRTFQALQDEEQAQILRGLSQTLITTFDVEGVMDVLATSLPRLGIPSCYLALYENPQAPAAWSRLRMAYTEQGRIPLEPDGRQFPSPQLVPDGCWPQGRRCTYVVEPLYFHAEPIGMVLFEVGPRDGPMYDALRGEISSALQGALLVQRIQRDAVEIARQKYVLDTFLANVPDSIYFKDCDSRFTQVNQALAQRFGVRDPAELVGKSDFDFFPAAQAQPKYDQEQAILHTGQSLLNQEEPDARGSWSLTTKMPLRDEHGDIIGTFGISRDITELKKAQQALAQAYSEISVLNVQLQEENVRMGAELSVVKQLQQMILPRPQELANIPGLEIVGYMQPADEVGGDYYDVLHNDGVLHIGIGDVTGHGLESGVIMLMTQAAIRTLIEHGETDPVKFVNTLNRLIYKNAQRIGTDKNLTFALVQYHGGQFKLVGQHEELLVIRRGGQVERMSTMDLGFPVGLEPEITDWVHASTVTLATGDGLVLYTDGITEAENTIKEQYGLERLCAVVSQHWEQSAEAIKQAVVVDVMAHIGTQKVYDDITLVVLKQQ